MKAIVSFIPSSESSAKAEEIQFLTDSDRETLRLQNWIKNTGGVVLLDPCGEACTSPDPAFPCRGETNGKKKVD